MPQNSRRFSATIKRFSAKKSVMETGSRPRAEPTMEMADWRSQLRPDSRRRIVNKIMDTLRRHLPFSGQEGLNELNELAMRIEERIYTAATSQRDYLRRLSLKMLSVDSRSQNAVSNSLPQTLIPNGAGPSN